MSNRFAFILLVALAAACASAPRSADEVPPMGLASWYGQEYAGRTTANGEIFDPSQLTAAHRTLPFGTIVEVRNPANGKAVQVRINDRGPFVGNRVIDLSYAAARAIDLIEPGVAQVEINVVKLGRGVLDPPAPYVVTIQQPERIISVPDDPPEVPFPLPSGREASSEAVVDDVQVEVISRSTGQPVRKRVSDDGRSVETVSPEGQRAREAPPSSTATRAPRPASPAPRAVVEGNFVVQLGAFESEANAKALRDRAAAVDPGVFVVLVGDLHRVRVGPYPTRAAAIEAKERLEAAGFATIILSR